MLEPKAITTGTDIRVIHWKLDCKLSTLHALSKDLSSDEMQRADRFIFPLHRDRYIAARGTLRIILATHLGLIPSAIRFTYGQYGKPEIDVPVDGSCHFNLSHSGNSAAVAISDRLVVGLDIEESELGNLSIAKSIFSKDELNRFLALSEADRRSSLMRAWTRKEAVLKALGTGFSVEPTDLEVTFEPSVPARLLALHRPTPKQNRLSIEDLALDVCPYCAIAAIDKPSNVKTVIQEFRH